MVVTEDHGNVAKRSGTDDHLEIKAKTFKKAECKKIYEKILRDCFVINRID